MQRELYNIDCMEYMARQPDNSFDLAIVDPPYGIKICSKKKVGGGSKGIPPTIFEKKD